MSQEAKKALRREVTGGDGGCYGRLVGAVGLLQEYSRSDRKARAYAFSSFRSPPSSSPPQATGAAGWDGRESRREGGREGVSAELQPGLRCACTSRLLKPKHVPKAVFSASGRFLHPQFPPLRLAATNSPTCRSQRAVISAPGFRIDPVRSGGGTSQLPNCCVSLAGTIVVFLSDAAINILFVLAPYRLCQDRGAATEVGLLHCFSLGSGIMVVGSKLLFGFVFLMYLILFQVSLVTGLGTGWEETRKRGRRATRFSI
ncbi:PREDICTED: uncharacterized protein LOC105815272 [Propithecus coquereli]|uniref:uncharacterized protein LOC105815272 n=1 Tax=Propithecus coquereli TaxID=379532 RepID=UPI00063ED6A2|nr:PREDICTED: uncharacterized protein LOC105815272 [Propithecus coquereli]